MLLQSRDPHGKRLEVLMTSCEGSRWLIRALAGHLEQHDMLQAPPPLGQVRHHAARGTEVAEDFLRPRLVGVHQHVAVNPENKQPYPPVRTLKAPRNLLGVHIAIELPEEAGKGGQAVLGRPAQAHGVGQALLPAEGLAGVRRLQELPTSCLRIPDLPSTGRFVGVVGVLQDVISILRDVYSQGPQRAKVAVPAEYVQAARGAQLAEALRRPGAGARGAQEVAAAEGVEDLVVVSVILQVIIVFDQSLLLSSFTFLFPHSFGFQLLHVQD
mmetsp:Transcript_52834/g.153733  ORF Transcript_52834/g.153733 Transcript_52834/m.153733 type:complete len:270 (+) Transcript_52834:108-917(+)